MTKADNGIWTIKLGPVKPDIYPYHFVVDGVAKKIDPSVKLNIGQ